MPTNRPVRRRGRRETRPNVYIAPDKDEAEAAAAPAVLAEEEDQAQPIDRNVVRTAVRRTPRSLRNRRVMARSEVYTRTLGRELRKMGLLTGAIIVALVVLTFVMN